MRQTGHSCIWAEQSAHAHWWPHGAARCVFGLVKQMMHVCEALSAMASYDSPHLEAMGAVCISVCEDCERQCRIHEDHQQECKDCADACAVLVREIRALSA